ncbi:unnamed protein product [Paramecium octaurelia]|uniref:Kinesin motor domain-containing protein n=1 Tax=Paramecium octaurelia TaxID=43137 RepID=A0A8S1XKT6_PAROT|nr:unnamed protein product [Paramecium octaurelia]
MYEKVKVAVRLRPLLDEELLTKDKSVCVDSIDTSKKSIIIKKDFEKRQFHFDTVFDPKVTQSQIYNDVARNIVASVIKGFNGTIFCYGQTGTGKTYTIMGKIDTEERGITPRTFEQIFHDISLDDEYTYNVQMGYLQIYMEMLLDLIRPDNFEVKIRESLDQGVFISGLEWLKVASPQECLKIINLAEKNKVVAFTNLNAHSSRSHSILIIKLEKQSQRQHSKSITIFQKSHKQKTNLSQDITFEQLDLNNNSNGGTLYLVDLAGSERIKKSKASGDRLNEARSINCSLTALGKCIHALTGPKNTFIPFRDSKLTRILQEALGGNCKTALIVNIGPAGKHVEETLSSLTFGMRAMKITNTLQINQTVDFEQLVQQLKVELQMKDEIISKLETQKSKANYQDNQMSNSEMQYKIKLEKVEEQHKGFLEEIDKVMVEQEQENEQLKKQLAQVMIEFEESKSREEVLQQENLILTQRLNKLDIELSKAQSSVIIFLLQFQNVNLRNQVQQSKELSKDQQLQEITFRNCALIQVSREKQNQQWRSELQQITSQYANRLEEVKRFEIYHSGKENENMQHEKQQIDDLTSQIKQLKFESTINQDKESKQNQIINQLNQQILKLNQLRESDNFHSLEQIKQLESEKFQIQFLLEQSENKSNQLLQKLEQSELYFKQILEVNSQNYNKLQEENFGLNKQIQIIQEQYDNLQKIQQQQFQYYNYEKQVLKQQNDECHLQLQQVAINNKDLQLQSNLEKSTMQSLDNKSLRIDFLNTQLQSNEQNFDIELKKSITVSGQNEGQIVIEMQIRIQQLEDYIENLQNQIQQRDLQEQTICYATVRSLLEELVNQVEQNILITNDTLEKSSDNNQIFQNGEQSYNKQNIQQLVQSLLIESRQHDQQITECEEFSGSEIEFQLKNFEQQEQQNQSQLDDYNHKQQPAFSFSQEQKRIDQPRSQNNSIRIQNQQKFKIQESQFEASEINCQIYYDESFEQCSSLSLQNQNKNNDQHREVIERKQQNELKSKQTKKIEKENLYQVIKYMSQLLKDQNKKECKDTYNTLDALRSSMLDFNNLCNTLTTYFS